MRGLVLWAVLWELQSRFNHTWSLPTRAIWSTRKDGTRISYMFLFASCISSSTYTEWSTSTDWILLVRPPLLSMIELGSGLANSLLAMVLHVAGYFTTIILLPATTEVKHTATYVFTNFSNNSGWEYDGIAFCAAIMTTMYGFGGIESAAHFAEEIQHVTRSLPRASKFFRVRKASKRSH